MKTIVIKNLPLTPSINRQHAVVRGRIIKSSAARHFDARCAHWINFNKLIVSYSRTECKKIIEQGHFLKVDCYFVLHEEKLVWKHKGTLRKNDQNNKLKATLDFVSRIIEIDDTYFVSNLAEKIPCKSLSDEQLIVKISQCRMRDLSEILQSDTIAQM